MPPKSRKNDYNTIERDWFYDHTTMTAAERSIVERNYDDLLSNEKEARKRILNRISKARSRARGKAPISQHNASDRPNRTLDPPSTFDSTALSDSDSQLKIQPFKASNDNQVSQDPQPHQDPAMSIEINTLTNSTNSTNTTNHLPQREQMRQGHHIPPSSTSMGGNNDIDSQAGDKNNNKSHLPYQSALTLSYKLLPDGLIPPPQSQPATLHSNINTTAATTTNTTTTTTTTNNNNSSLDNNNHDQTTFDSTPPIAQSPTADKNKLLTRRVRQDLRKTGETQERPSRAVLRDELFHSPLITDEERELLKQDVRNLTQKQKQRRRTVANRLSQARSRAQRRAKPENQHEANKSAPNDVQSLESDANNPSSVRRKALRDHESQIRAHPKNFDHHNDDRIPISDDFPTQTVTNTFIQKTSTDLSCQPPTTSDKPKWYGLTHRGQLVSPEIIGTTPYILIFLPPITPATPQPKIEYFTHQIAQYTGINGWYTFFVTPITFSDLFLQHRQQQSLQRSQQLQQFLQQHQHQQDQQDQLQQLILHLQQQQDLQQDQQDQLQQFLQQYQQQQDQQDELLQLIQFLQQQNPPEKNEHFLQQSLYLPTPPDQLTPYFQPTTDEYPLICDYDGRIFKTFEVPSSLTSIRWFVVVNHTHIASGSISHDHTPTTTSTNSNLLKNNVLESINQLPPQPVPSPINQQSYPIDFGSSADPLNIYHLPARIGTYFPEILTKPEEYLRNVLITITTLRLSFLSDYVRHREDYSPLKKYTIMLYTLCLLARACVNLAIPLAPFQNQPFIPIYQTFLVHEFLTFQSTDAIFDGYHLSPIVYHNEAEKYYIPPFDNNSLIMFVENMHTRNRLALKTTLHPPISSTLNTAFESHILFSCYGIKNPLLPPTFADLKPIISEFETSGRIYTPSLAKRFKNLNFPPSFHDTDFYAKTLVEYSRQFFRTITNVLREPSLLSFPISHNHPSFHSIENVRIGAKNAMFTTPLLNDLYTFFHLNSRLVFEQSWDIAHQLVTAIDYLHGIGIAHLDIKPDNVFAEVIQDRVLVKVGDFASAQVGSFHSIELVEGSIPTELHQEAFIKQLPPHHQFLFSSTHQVSSKLNALESLDTITERMILEDTLPSLEILYNYFPFLRNKVAFHDYIDAITVDNNNMTYSYQSYCDKLQRKPPSRVDPLTGDHSDFDKQWATAVAKHSPNLEKIFPSAFQSQKPTRHQFVQYALNDIQQLLPNTPPEDIQITVKPIPLAENDPRFFSTIFDELPLSSKLQKPELSGPTGTVGWMAPEVQYIHVPPNQIHQLRLDSDENYRSLHHAQDQLPSIMEQHNRSEKRYQHHKQLYKKYKAKYQHEPEDLKRYQLYKQDKQHISYLRLSDLDSYKLLKTEYQEKHGITKIADQQYEQYKQLYPQQTYQEYKQSKQEFHNQEQQLLSTNKTISEFGHLSNTYIDTFTNKGPYNSFKADSFSLGLTLFFILHGHTLPDIMDIYRGINVDITKIKDKKDGLVTYNKKLHHARQATDSKSPQTKADAFYYHLHDCRIKHPHESRHPPVVSSWISNQFFLDIYPRQIYDLLDGLLDPDPQRRLSVHKAAQWFDKVSPLDSAFAAFKAYLPPILQQHVTSLDNEQYWLYLDLLFTFYQTRSSDDIHRLCKMLRKCRKKLDSQINWFITSSAHLSSDPYENQTVLMPRCCRFMDKTKPYGHVRHCFALECLDIATFCYAHLVAVKSVLEANLDPADYDLIHCVVKLKDLTSSFKSVLDAVFSRESFELFQFQQQNDIGSSCCHFEPLSRFINHILSTKTCIDESLRSDNRTESSKYLFCNETTCVVFRNVFNDHLAEFLSQSVSTPSIIRALNIPGLISAFVLTKYFPIKNNDRLVAEIVERSSLKLVSVIYSQSFISHISRTTTDEKLTMLKELIERVPILRHMIIYSKSVKLFNTLFSTATFAALHRLVVAFVTQIDTARSYPDDKIPGQLNESSQTGNYQSLFGLYRELCRTLLDHFPVELFVAVMGPKNDIARRAWTQCFLFIQYTAQINTTQHISTIQQPYIDFHSPLLSLEFHLDLARPKERYFNPIDPTPLDHDPNAFTTLAQLTDFPCQGMSFALAAFVHQFVFSPALFFMQSDVTQLYNIKTDTSSPRSHHPVFKYHSLFASSDPAQTQVLLQDFPPFDHPLISTIIRPFIPLSLTYLLPLSTSHQTNQPMLPFTPTELLIIPHLLLNYNLSAALRLMIATQLRNERPDELAQLASFVIVLLHIMRRLCCQPSSGFIASSLLHFPHQSQLLPESLNNLPAGIKDEGKIAYAFLNDHKLMHIQPSGSSSKLASSVEDWALSQSTWHPPYPEQYAPHMHALYHQLLSDVIKGFSSSPVNLPTHSPSDSTMADTVVSKSPHSLKLSLPWIVRNTELGRIVSADQTGEIDFSEMNVNDQIEDLMVQYCVELLHDSFQNIHKFQLSQCFPPSRQQIPNNNTVFYHKHPKYPTDSNSSPTAQNLQLVHDDTCFNPTAPPSGHHWCVKSLYSRADPVNPNQTTAFQEFQKWLSVDHLFDLNSDFNIPTEIHDQCFMQIFVSNQPSNLVPKPLPLSKCTDQSQSIQKCVKFLFATNQAFRESLLGPDQQ